MLNDLKIKQLKPEEKIYRVADHSGLCIEVRPTGAKFWRYRYRFHSKAKMLTIGQYPSITLAQARSKTIEYKGLLAQSIDPSQVKKEETKVALQSNLDTFSAVVEEYLEFQAKNKPKEWLANRQRYLKKDIYPVIAKKPISDIDSSDIKLILDNTLERISKGKRFTGEVKAKFVRQIVGEIMQYAIITNKIKTDPTYALRRYINTPTVEHAHPIDPADKPIVMEKIDAYLGPTSTRNALKAIIYTMLRSIEVRRAQKKFIDFENKTWTIPVASKAELLNNGRQMKKNRIHVVPLSDQMIEILKEQFELYPNTEFIFPGQDEHSMIGKTTFNSAFKNMGLGHITMHDFRATASTTLYEKNYNSDWIELQLAHVKGDRVRASYDHAKWLDDRRKMMQDWANIVDGWSKVSASSSS